MSQALSLGLKGKGFTSPNPCVGAVVVKDGRIVGKGWHHAAGQPHAEVEAIEDAKGHTQNATIYVTLEPCNHFGRTPPCTQKIIGSGITRVVVGCKDPNPNVCGGGIKTLEAHGIKVTSGVLEDKARTLIEDFIWYTLTKRPFVTLKCAATLDGRIATSTGDSKWITGEASRGLGHRLRHESDAILIGSGTLEADNPSLTARIPGQKTKDPIRIVLDSNLKISPEARVIQQDSPCHTIIACGPGASPEKKRGLEKAGAKILELGMTDTGLDLTQLVIKLGQMSVMSLLIEGGGKVASSALKAGIVNKVCYFMAPKILGGSDGVPVFGGKGPEKISQVFTFKRMTVERVEEDILVQGYLKE